MNVTNNFQSHHDHNTVKLAISSRVNNMVLSWHLSYGLSKVKSTKKRTQIIIATPKWFMVVGITIRSISYADQFLYMSCSFPWTTRPTKFYQLYIKSNIFMGQLSLPRTRTHVSTNKLWIDLVNSISVPG